MQPLRSTLALSAVAFCFAALLQTLPAMPAAAGPAQALVSRTLELKRLGRPTEALAPALEAARIAPADPDARWVAAWAQAERGRSAEALAEFAAFLKLAPADPRATEAKAAILRLGGTPPAAASAAPEPATRAAAPAAPAGQPAAAPAPPQTAPAPALPATAAMTPADRIARLLADAPLKTDPERLGGGVMVKYKLRLEDGSPKGLKAVFKPRQTGDQSFVYEIVAYRLDRICAMGRVPVTVKRDLPVARLASVPGGFGRLKPSGSLVGGSLQQWVNEASDPFGMQARSWAEEWLARLARPGAALPDLNTARAVADMFLLDYLQGNMDRYSGGNILRDAAGRIWLIDNSEAFGSSTQPRRDFDRLKRFHGASMEALRRATEEDFARELGPWLSQTQLRGLLDRRRHALSRADELVRTYGREKAAL